MTDAQTQFVSDLQGAIAFVVELNPTVDAADLISGLIAITVATAYQHNVLDASSKAFQNCVDNVECAFKAIV